MIGTDVTDRKLEDHTRQRRSTAAIRQAGPVQTVSAVFRYPDGTTEHLELVMVDLDDPNQREARVAPRLGIHFKKWLRGDRLKLVRDSGSNQWWAWPIDRVPPALV
jgi:hypothetical protein